jgi:sugar phosphate isomerase/epimerase
MRFAFSTVACPDWTLERVAAAAETCGFMGVELRTFGWGSSASACDPALTSPAKVQETLRAAGADPVCLSTSVRFDAAVTPPVIGWAISDVNKSAREGRALVDLAAQVGAPFIRVFGFEHHSSEKRSRAVDRIVGRLLQVADAGRARQVRVLVENGGSFSTAAEVSELLDEADHPCLGVLYNVAEAHAAGETPEHGINVLGPRLMMAKVKDFAHGKPAVLGEGSVPVRAAVGELRRTGFNGPVSYEMDRAWLGMDLDPMPFLKSAAERMYRWGAAEFAHA